MPSNPMTMADTAAAVASLSDAGDSFALASPDGRIKTFDTASGRLKNNFVGQDGTNVVENGDAMLLGNGHLMEQLTCITWGSCTQKESGKGKKKAGTESKLVAVGTASGDVVAFDVGLGKLKWRVKECNEGGVLGLSSSTSSGGAFYSTGQDGQVCVIDAATGKVREKFQAGRLGLHAIAVSPDCEHVLVGSSGMALWNTGSQKCVCKFTGHPTRVQSLSISPSGTFGVSCAKAERSAVVWWLAGPYKKKDAIAAGLLNTESPVVSVGVYASTTETESDDDSETFTAMAITSAGEAYVWDCSEGSKPRTVESVLVARVKVKGAFSSEEAIHAARVEGKAKGRILLLARGSLVKPTFERIPLSKASESPDKTLELEPTGSGLLLPSTKSSKSPSKAATRETVVGAAGALDDAEDVDMMLLPVSDAQAAKRKRKGTDESSSKATAEDANPEESGSLTLGERVAALSIGAGQSDGDAEEDEAAPSTSGPIKADSLGVLLLQALQSEDSSLLERCLNVSNESVIRNTVRRLPATSSVAFLKALVSRLQAKPARGELLGVWARALLSHHAAYLSGAPGASSALVALYQTLEARLASFQQLMGLSGRLDLMMSQLAQQGGEDTGGIGSGPAATFVLSDEEDDGDEGVIVEDPFAAGADDDDDDDDDDDGDEDEDDDDDDDDDDLEEDDDDDDE